MNYLKYIVMFVLLLSAGTVVAKVVKKGVDITQKENIATIYPGIGEIRIYKVLDDKNTCYVSSVEVNSSGIKLIDHNLSCVKN